MSANPLNEFANSLATKGGDLPDGFAAPNRSAQEGKYLNIKKGDVAAALARLFDPQVFAAFVESKLKDGVFFTEAATTQSRNRIFDAVKHIVSNDITHYADPNQSPQPSAPRQTGLLAEKFSPADRLYAADSLAQRPDAIAIFADFLTLMQSYFSELGQKLEKELSTSTDPRHQKLVGTAQVISNAFKSQQAVGSFVLGPILLMGLMQRDADINKPLDPDFFQRLHQNSIEKGLLKHCRPDGRVVSFYPFKTIFGVAAGEITNRDGIAQAIANGNLLHRLYGNGLDSNQQKDWMKKIRAILAETDYQLGERNVVFPFRCLQKAQL